MYRVRGIAREMMFEVRFDYRMVFFDGIGESVLMSEGRFAVPFRLTLEPEKSLRNRFKMRYRQNI